MKHETVEISRERLFARVADYAERNGQTLHASLSPADLKRGFDIGIPDEGRANDDIIRDLVSAAEPGLVGSTEEGFLSWVIGGSHATGVAADWLTSLWGQNAGIYQTSPASAACEEVAAQWLLDLLDLPRESGVGFVTGATMATFTCLAAARDEMLRRAGYDVHKSGLRGAPPVNIVIGADAHIANRAALRYLGFGARELIEIEADANGLMKPDALAAAARNLSGPTIIIVQAGHIHSGGFDPFARIAEIAQALGAWVHVDGAFGLWARASAQYKPLTDQIDQADSWAVDGHKWLQTPYDTGFAIVRSADALRRSMTKSAGYLNHDEMDGRSNCSYTPELSRRARAFPVWAMIQALGRRGLSDLVEQHCLAALRFAQACSNIEGAEVLNDVVLNQVAVDLGPRTQEICDALNASGRFFLRTASWRGRLILRVSFSGHASTVETADALAEALAAVMAKD